MLHGKAKSQQGVMLLEALMGILIFSIGILAILGMQGVAMRTTIDAKYRSEAGFLANEVIGTMWVDQANLANYATASLTCPTSPPHVPRPCDWINRVKTALPQDTTTPGNTAPIIVVNGRQVTVTVRWMRPGETTVSNHEAVATINGGT
jgi:type IV pilus assembly protein PilV